MKRFAALLLAVAGTQPAWCQAPDHVRIANEGSIGDRWMLAEGAQLAAPGYPGAFADRGDSVCIAMGYAIGPDGSTSEFSLLKAWSDGAQDREPVPGYWDAFIQAGAQALAQWRFQPKPDIARPQATYTVATLHFAGKAGDVAALRRRCAIPELAAFVQQQKSNGFYNGRDKHELDRLRREIEARRIAQAAAAARATFGNPGK